MRIAFVLLLLTAPLSAAEPKAADWKAGVAVQVITPERPMWMSGYANRNKPAEGKLTELYVKALALEDPHGKRFVLLTGDLVGIPRSLAEPVADGVRKRKGLPRERLMLTVSHTHCGPVLRDSLTTMYDMPPEEAKKIGPYTDKVKEWMIDVIVRALDDLKPASLSFGKGTARFAANRRKPTDKGFVNDAYPEGPVDHAVPVLRVETADGKLRDPPLWVAGYANDVMAYIPSQRVLKEGGYEGDTSMIYYGMPAKWGADIEEKIVAKVRALVEEARAGAARPR